MEDDPGGATHFDSNCPQFDGEIAPRNFLILLPRRVLPALDDGFLCPSAANKSLLGLGLFVLRQHCFCTRRLPRCTGARREEHERVAFME